ncbi:MAG: ATP-binding protein [bacterium]
MIYSIRNSIRKKLIFGAIIMLILVVAMSAVSIWSGYRVGKGGEIILNASSYISEIENLRLAFEKVLMPSHDYLIYGNLNEIYTFEDNIKRLKHRLNRVEGLIMAYEDKDIDLVVKPLNFTKENLIKVESLSRELLSIPDPQKIEAGKLMKEMDARTEMVRQKLEKLIQTVTSDKNSGIFYPVYEILVKFQNLLMPPHDYLITGKEAEKENYKILIENLTSEMDLLFKLAKPGKEKETIKATINDFKLVDDLARQILAIKDPLKMEAGYKMEEMDFISNEIIIKLDTILEYFKKEKELAKKKADRIKSAAFHFTVLISLVLVIGGFVAGLAFSSSITNPVRQLLLATQRISGGDLSHKAQITSNDEIGELARSFNNMTDNLRTYQAQLIQSSKLASMGVLAAGIAHEVNNPTNTIINYAGLLEDELKPDSELSNYVQGILKEGKRITNIVHNLLTFARAEKQEHTPCKVVDIINASLSFMKNYLSKEGINIKTSFDPDLPLIRAKSSQLEQVFVNLILNARDALNEKYPKPDPNKLIRIEVKKEKSEGKNYLRIIFTDTGSGIDQKNLDKIFDPFFTTKRADKGTGLGLSISYGIIIDHKGRVEVKSQKGKQTSFIINLLINEEDTPLKK